VTPPGVIRLYPRRPTPTLIPGGGVCASEKVIMEDDAPPGLHVYPFAGGPTHTPRPHKGRHRFLRGVLRWRYTRCENSGLGIHRTGIVC
jgi:hypothetical protein